MRRLLAGGIVIAALLLLPSLAAAYPDAGAAPRYFPSDCFPGADRRFVHDFIGLMDEGEAAVVEARACLLYNETSAHVVLALVPGLEGESLEGYATHLFEAWGIGAKGHDDGLLVLYVRDDGSGSGAVRVETGYGLEGTINSLIARQAVDSMAQVRQQALANGSTEPQATAHALAAGTLGLVGFLRGNYRDGHFTAVEDEPEDSEWDWPSLLLVAVVVLVLGLASRRRRGRFGGGGWGGRGGWGGGMGGGGWGGGRGGRGGGGFGGGRSGGGGWGGRLQRTWSADGPAGFRGSVA
ncbi:MAG TPA: TPM domain-containing protein [Candidatus Thermoplasmatota archaeon]|nr:TPM domain-containing protein [Candidatus Thermoplasmatota archaeon]